MERELPLRGRTIPGIVDLEIEQDRLVWGYGGTSRKAPVQGEGMLLEFVRLAGDDGRGILEYARKWGVLAICEHGLPCSHNPHPRLPCVPVPIEGERPVWATPSRYVEPLAAWRSLAARVQAIINIAAKLRLGEPATAEEWMAAKALPELFPMPIEDIHPDVVARVLSNPDSLTDAVQALLGIGNVRPQFVWRGERGYGVELGGMPAPGAAGLGSSLFGAIATQLAFMLSRSDGLAICSGCGRGFAASESRARRGTNRYCKQCRETGAAERDRVRRWRQSRNASGRTDTV